MGAPLETSAGYKAEAEEGVDLHGGGPMCDYVRYMELKYVESDLLRTWREKSLGGLRAGLSETIWRRRVAR